jgi:uncharacterized LabA/DUF88 family protein
MVSMSDRKKVVVFVDGENLVITYERMLAAGRVPETRKIATSSGGTITENIVTYVPKCFVWSPRIFAGRGLDLVRINYYTSVVGDDAKVTQVTEAIAQTPFWSFECSSECSPNKLIPRVHKKPAQSKKTKVVDVDITMDIFRAAQTMPIDAIMLLSGDGDYLPLIHDVVRSTSKQVYIAAFSYGLADQLRSCAEQFYCLDDDFFEPKPGRFGDLWRRVDGTDGEQPNATDGEQPDATAEQQPGGVRQDSSAT